MVQVFWFPHSLVTYRLLQYPTVSLINTTPIITTHILQVRRVSRDAEGQPQHDQTERDDVVRFDCTACTHTNLECCCCDGPGLVRVLPSALHASLLKASSTSGALLLPATAVVHLFASTATLDAYNAQSCWVDYQALRSPAGLY